MKLFSVYLGGKAPRSNTELHDVVFVVGNSIEETYEKLLDKWFGTAEGLHIDSWIELDIVDSHRVSLAPGSFDFPKKLYFLNLGAYAPGQFLEVHANGFIVAENEKAAIVRARKELFQDSGALKSVHTDYIYDVDECLEVTEVDGHSVRLEPVPESKALEPNNRYHILPKPLVADYVRRNPQRSINYRG